MSANAQLSVHLTIPVQVKDLDFTDIFRFAKVEEKKYQTLTEIDYDDLLNYYSDEYKYLLDNPIRDANGNVITFRIHYSRNGYESWCTTSTQLEVILERMYESVDDEDGLDEEDTGSFSAKIEATFVVA